jgi:tetratricopeptide (TPR) repeat protein
MIHPDFAEYKETTWQAFQHRDLAGTVRTATEALEASAALDFILIGGVALTRGGELDHGFEWCCAALSIGKAEPEDFLNAAMAFTETQDYRRAMIFFQRGIERYPDHADLQYRCGICLSLHQQWEASIQFLDRAMALGLTGYGPRMARAVSLRMLNRWDEAIAEFEETALIADGVDHDEIIANHSSMLMEMGRNEEALAIFDRVVDKERPRTLFNKSLIMLGTGRWPEAWQLCRHRFEAHRKTNELMGRPRRAGTLDEIKGRRCLFMHEQGIGDGIQFLRYARLLRPYVKELVVAVPSVLARVARRLDVEDYEVEVLADRRPEYGPDDVMVPLLDAPDLLQQRLDNIPSDRYFLPVPEALIAKRKLRLPDGPRKPRVGIVWAGREHSPIAPPWTARRSITFPMIERALLDIPGIDFISLQQTKADREEERSIPQPIGDTFDVLDTMAVIEQLDLVISVDTSVAHMAGAIQKPVWMISRFDGCWRWFFDGRTTSPWYPSMRVFRQDKAGDWSGVLGQVRQHLQREFQ